MTQRATPPPRVRGGGGRAAGGQQRPPETVQFGDTTEREVRATEGTGGRPPIPVEESEFPTTVQSSVRLSGTRLADLAAGGDDEAGRRGIGPLIVVLHNIVSGPGTKGGVALSRGKVVRLSALLGEDLTEALDPDFFDENEQSPTNRKLVARARRLLAHYTGGENPAIREARADERGLDTIIFAESEEEVMKALDARDKQLGDALEESERMRAVVQQIAAAADDPAAIADILARSGVAGSPGFGREAVGSSAASRLNPDDKAPEKIGDETPGRRDSGFMQQQPSGGGDERIPTRGKVEQQGATSEVEENLEESFDPDAEEDEQQ